VEANYFGKDGVFLVAEEEQKVVGIAGANMIDLDTCELRRIYVAKDFRRRGIGRKMLSIIVSIAKRLDYKRLVVGDTPRDGTSPSLPEFRATTEKFFECLGFSIPSSKTNISLVQLQLAL